MKALNLAVGLGLMAGNLQATDRFFKDLEATSPNGRFCVEAKSPDNVDGPWKKPFQDEFLYRLLEKDKGGEVWSRKQPMEADGLLPREGSPAAIYVSDDGWVVIRTADIWNQHAELVVVNRVGQDKLRVDILKALFPDDTGRFRYVAVTTAGLHWGEGYCRFYFVTLRGKPHFCLTTWWGKRLLLDLSAGRIVSESAEFKPELVKAEKAFVLATLEAMSLWKYNLEERINPGLAKSSPGPSVADASAAMLLAAKLNILEAVPLVRKLEASPIVSTTTSGPSSYEAPDGGVRPAVYQTLRLRQVAHLCLRRLGVRPSAHQSTRLYRGDSYWYPQDPLPFQRENRVRDLKPGMKPEEVLTLIGAPDFINHEGWEYDLDGDEPATLAIRWGQAGCEKIEKRTPPKWRYGDERDCELAH